MLLRVCRSAECLSLLPTPPPPLQALERHGVLLSPQDYFSVAIGIDPDGAGARVRCSLVTRELQD